MVFHMKRSDHCQRAVKSFGQDFEHVHVWLDELFGIYRGRHRRFRHHMKGVKRVREKWGDTAAEVAIQHIVDDLISIEDPMANEAWIAKDQEDYIKRGYL